MKKTVFRKKNLRESPYIGQGALPLFPPVFDSTDHFHFVCKDCREIVDILLIERDDSYADSSTLYFWMRCPLCGNKGVRKIYLEDSGKHFLQFPVTTEILARSAEEAKPGIVKRR